MEEVKSKIQNSKELGANKLRLDALSILGAGLLAIDSQEAVKRSVKIQDNTLIVQRKKFDLSKFDRVFVVGFGKCSCDAALAIENVLGKERITDGIVLDVKKRTLSCVRAFEGTHPHPSFQNVRATHEILNMLKGVGERDLVIVIASGGGSALLCDPYNLRCVDLQRINQALFKAGANISEINTIRKHISLIHGGQLARIVYPATVVGLIFSDVPGNALDMVASGPTVRDTTTVTDAQKLLKKYKIAEVCGLSVCELTETPKEKLYFDNVYNFLICSNTDALTNMAREAKKLGYKAKILTDKLQGEARKVGLKLIKDSKKGQALIAGGETTVTIKGTGSGGRNQELVLGAISAIKQGQIIASIASDGIDNTPVAGALADNELIASAKKKRIDPKRYLLQNNSFEFFKKAGGYIVTGPTGSNVSDLVLVLRSK
ncbi:MAG: hypothetical protein ACD_76C00081G0003 [uncultured bacterium]|nr:MAG: hypothetical protein ACD_76C00081G0003 [uncultured bacterium]HBD05516.1 glycerate kinase [Candidatus Uhrbacteria bacterium]